MNEKKKEKKEGKKKTKVRIRKGAQSRFPFPSIHPFPFFPLTRATHHATKNDTALLPSFFSPCLTCCMISLLPFVPLQLFRCRTSAHMTPDPPGLYDHPSPPSHFTTLFPTSVFFSFTFTPSNKNTLVAGNKKNEAMTIGLPLPFIIEQRT